MTAPVAVVFVATDENNFLFGALESLFASTTPPPEVVVVDNCSQESPVPKIASSWPAVKVLSRERRFGLPANLNFGFSATTAPYVMLCNCDVIFKEGSVEALARFLEEHSRAGVAAPKLLDPQGERRASARRWYTPLSLMALQGPWSKLLRNSALVRRSLYEDWDYRSARMVDWTPFSATMVRRAAFEQVGLMDERFWVYFDDVDICLRMHEAGWEVWCVPDSEIVHIEQRSSSRPFSRAWRWHLASMIKFWLKHRALKPS